MAHDASHGRDGTHVEAHPAAHGGHHDVSADKGAAFAGLIGGMVFIGSLLFSMVKWTNHHLGAEHGSGAAAESTK